VFSAFVGLQFVSINTPQILLCGCGEKRCKKLFDYTLCGDWLKKTCSGFRPNEKYKTFFLKKGKATLNRHIGLE